MCPRVSSLGENEYHVVLPDWINCEVPVGSSESLKGLSLETGEKTAINFFLVFSLETSP